MSEADFIRRVTSMVKRIPGVTDNIIDTFIEPDLTGLVNEYCQWSEKVEEDLRQQRELIRVLMQKTSLLEKRLKQSIMSQRRRDYNVVKNNVIVKSQKDTSEVKKFIANVVELGGGAKLVQKNLAVVEIPPAPGQVRRSDDKIYRVALADGQKGHLFKGLAKPGHNSQTLQPSANGFKVDFRVDNETPQFLGQTKRNLERIAYSLRQKYRESHHVKTKIVFSSYKLRLRIRDKNNTSWINLDNQAAALYMDTEVIFKPEEAPREGIPTVKQFYTTTLEALD